MAKCLTLVVIRCKLVIVPINWFYICYPQNILILELSVSEQLGLLYLKLLPRATPHTNCNFQHVFFCCFLWQQVVSPAERRYGYVLPVRKRMSWSPYWKQFSNWLSSWQIGTLCNWVFKNYFLKSKISTYTITNVLSMTFWIFRIEAKAVGV